MLSSTQFVKQSLETHLFFARIMKEHSFFLEVGFTPRDAKFTQQANTFRMEFDRLLESVIMLSNGVVSPGVLQSGEVFTPYTLKAEMASAYFTGIRIPTQLTNEEANLKGGDIMPVTPMLEQKVAMLNQRSIDLISSLAQFKSIILSNVLSCKMFTVNYPLLIDHILREANFYIHMIQRIQNREDLNANREAYEQELFWNRIMAEHAKFIRGLLDPTETELFNSANNFGNEFDQLVNESKQAMDNTIPLKKATEDSLKATMEIRNFKEAGTKGILECKIKSIIIPLLADHTLREANHYLRLLNMYKAEL